MSGRARVFLEDVADDVTVGHVGPMATEYVPDGIPFLRSLNVQPFTITHDDIRFITPDFQEVSTCTGRRCHRAHREAGNVRRGPRGAPGGELL